MVYELYRFKELIYLRLPFRNQLIKFLKDNLRNLHTKIIINASFKGICDECSYFAIALKY